VTRPQLERHALRLAFLVACLGALWAIWSVPLVMTNDGPEAVLTAHMESHYDDPGSIYARQFAVGFGLSGRGFSVLYRPIAAVCSWRTALRVSELVIVLSLAFAVGWLSKAVSGRARFSCLVGFAIAFSWPFYMGFFAFTLSMAVGLMVLAFVVSRSQGLSRIDKAAVTTALLVQLFLHGFAVFITLALVALVVMTRAAMKRSSVPAPEWRRDTLREAVWLAVTALPSVVVVLLMRTAQAHLATLANSEKAEWASPSEWARVLPRLAVPGSTSLGLVIFALALFAIVRTALRLRRAPRRPEEVALVIGGAGLLLAALFLPLDLPGWQFFAPRFLTTGLAVSLSLLGTETFERRPARVAFEAGLVALVAAALLNARALHQRLATACEDGLAGLDHTMPRSSFQLPITFDATCGLPTDNTLLDVPYATPLLHFSALFAVSHGGTVPYGFYGPAAVHAFVPRNPVPVPVPPYRYWGLQRKDPRLTHPEARTAMLSELAVFGTYYENILVFGASASDRALLLDRGYVIDFEHGSFINAHDVPCAVELVSEVLAGDPPVMIRGGAREEELWPARITPTADRRGIKASLTMLCGDVWVRVHWQNSERRCANADALGRIALHAEHATPARVVCER
jgi:hypothetical protein